MGEKHKCKMALFVKSEYCGKRCWRNSAQLSYWKGKGLDMYLSMFTHRRFRQMYKQVYNRTC